MVDVHELKHGMRVVDSHGKQLGTIDNATVDGIKLAKNSTTDGQHHHVAADRIARVEGDTVHLTISAAELPIGAATTAHAATSDKKSILPWILGALAALLLLFFLLRGCDREEDTTAVAPVATETTAAEVGTAPVAGTIAEDVRTYLADANGAVPRTFTFEKLNFDTGSAAIRDADRTDLDNLAGVLTANPNVRVRVVGYTDAQGSAQPNAELGAQRARAVAEALTAKGVTANRIETASGGEANPTDTNATAGGRFENRRTELIVLNR